MERLFKRRSDQQWWHWRPDCEMWLAVPMWKERGKIIVYETLDAARPTTEGLCPGCKALDARIRTRSYPYFTPKVEVRPGFKPSALADPNQKYVVYNPWGV
jgi:hypothetical protein